jgi:hypothetical protein
VDCLAELGGSMLSATVTTSASDGG